ncbi:cob(I)yrinic acid a,c-diamide adenosyltransferase [Clostridium boliviensis]|uniref:Cob(I)yrinic acid a,c-diamide adenosyltransferase n=1 Tax=Clostridium boliviensis TaxID=318465 RepID=A0ABU4GKP6_9CLOT|nr:cob(I)yrinic acid a,c-diamide adenosyltransferase [Clostridium boliviensis]MDW2796842.1 cob(I)yrinic acid a,c-diamide adenosyltransferase [Clostridium boliviensis]
MNRGMIQVICGEGKGKTSSALGMGIEALTKNRTVIMIQFLKGCQGGGSPEIIKRLEPEMKIFWFEKCDGFFENLSVERQEEERMNIRNGLNFARKVVSTGECDMLILDEILGLLDQGIVEAGELIKLLQSKVDEMEVVLTGKIFPKEIEPYVDSILEISHVKVDNIK